MGFDHATVQFLAQAPRLGLSLEHVVTLGRQTMTLLPEELQRLLMQCGISCTPAQARQMFEEQGGYSEPFLKHLGAGEIHSMDISPYESASIVHDLNQPLPEQHHGRFSLLIDGGSLEHVFNYPVAIANCLNAVRPGGHMLTITPANNLLGHGFYQFSPELLFRVFSPSNGYRLQHLIVYEHPWNGAWYKVKDPREARSRVELTNHRPVYMIACAQRTAVVPLFTETPQQSDYARIWKESDGEVEADAPPNGWKQAVPLWMVQWFWKLRPFNPRYFQKLPPRLS